MKTDPTSLDRLHDLVQPPAVPWWPPAPGWYWVLGLLALLASIGLVKALLHWQRNRYRREALHLAALQQHHLQDPTTRTAALVALGELLKRTALTAFPREQTASLTGASWLAFLDRTSGHTGSVPSEIATLETVAYDPRTSTRLNDTQALQLAAAVRDWLANHRMPNPPGGSS